MVHGAHKVQHRFEFEFMSCVSRPVVPNQGSMVDNITIKVLASGPDRPYVTLVMYDKNGRTQCWRRKEKLICKDLNSGFKIAFETNSSWVRGRTSTDLQGFYSIEHYCCFVLHSNKIMELNVFYFHTHA